MRKMQKNKLLCCEIAESKRKKINFKKVLPLVPEAHHAQRREVRN